jgi:hypothetical protein
LIKTRDFQAPAQGIGTAGVGADMFKETAGFPDALPPARLAFPQAKGGA